MGTTAAEPLVKINRELKIRCQPQVFLRPYNYEDPLDLTHWTKFVDLIDNEMLARDIVKSPAGFKYVAEDLCKASNGLIGEFHGIVLAALEAALNDGEDYISHDRLVSAVDEWAVSDGTVEENPFRVNQQNSGSDLNGFGDEHVDGRNDEEFDA